MLKAELGDILYYIIFAVVILASVLEKMTKSKRKKQEEAAKKIPQPQHYDEFEEADAQPVPAQPQSIEDMMRRMFETIEPAEETEALPTFGGFTPGMMTEEARSSEYIPQEGRFFYCPIEISQEQSVIDELIEEEEIAAAGPKFQFDIRQAVIASEILNRRY